MALNNLPTDILAGMFQYLEVKESASLIETCSEWDSACKENGGYLRKIQLTPEINGNEYLQTYSRHARTIERVYVDNQTDPHHWIIRFPKLVNCAGCDLTEDFIPHGGKQCETEILTFRNIGENSPKVLFKTDWSLFPKLRRLVLFVEEVDLTGLDKLKQLDTIVIYTANGTYKRDGTVGKIVFTPSEKWIADHPDIVRQMEMLNPDQYPSRRRELYALQDMLRMHLPIDENGTLVWNHYNPLIHED